MASDLLLEASDLGWPAGERRTWFERDGKRFWYRDTAFERREVVGWLYSAADGPRIMVFND